MEVPPSRKVNKTLYSPFGIKLKNTKTVTKTLGPSTDRRKLTASCPSSHPFLISGGSDAVEPGLAEFSIVDDAVGWHAWRTVRQAYEFFCYGNNLCWYSFAPPTWTLRVTLECGDVVKQPVNAKIGQ